MILNYGSVRVNIVKRRIWKNEEYCSEDLFDFCQIEDSFIKQLEGALDKRNEVMKCDGKIIEFETYEYNLKKAHYIMNNISSSLDK